MGKKVWFIPLAIILFIGYKKLNLAKRYSVYFKGFDFTTLSFLNPVLTLKVGINNPTDGTADLQKINGILKLDGKYVGSVNGISPTLIQTGETILNVPITLDYDGVFNILSKLKETKFVFDFNGTIVIDFISLPLDFTY